MPTLTFYTQVLNTINFSCVKLEWTTVNPHIYKHVTHKIQVAREKAVLVCEKLEPCICAIKILPATLLQWC